MRKHKLFPAVIILLSVILHLSTYMGMMGYAAYTYLKKADVIEVDLLPRQSPKGTSKSRQIVSSRIYLNWKESRTVAAKTLTTKSKNHSSSTATGRSNDRPNPKSLAKIAGSRECALKMNKTIELLTIKKKQRWF